MASISLVLSRIQQDVRKFLPRSEINTCPIASKAGVSV
jgi:hypothetical protein